MHDEVKRAIDNGKGSDLRYLFVDSFNIDASFESYQEDFEYCLKHDVFDKHRELTPFRYSEADWSKEYWLNLKLDLQENFSEKRMRHMIAVARVIYKDNIKHSTSNTTTVDSTAKNKMKYVVNQEQKMCRIEYLPQEDDPEIQEKKRIEKIREEYKRREKEERRSERTIPSVEKSPSRLTYRPKKAKGVPLVPIIAGAAVGLLLLLLMTRR